MIKQQNLLLFAVILVLSLVSSTHPVSAARSRIASTTPVGTVHGSESVDEDGQLRYSISIEVPPGRAGMAPALSLEYSSGGGDGLLGLGFYLGGLSAITRGSNTIAQDGVRQDIQLDESDRFYLDGRRLVAVRGTYGGDGTEYRTEIETFSRIRSYSTGGLVGPGVFEVSTRDGLIRKYGTRAAVASVSTSTGTRALEWLLSEVIDRHGNAMSIQYEIIGTGERIPEVLPKSIAYTGRTGSLSSSAGDRSIIFNYESRPDERRGYQLGLAMWRTRRLLSIQTYVGTEHIREYR